MHRIVFFGMDGVYATTPLKALVKSGLAPSLVVVGRERERRNLRGSTRIRPARPGVLDRLQAKLTSQGDEVSDLVAVAHAFGIDVVDTNSANEGKAAAAIRDAKPDAYVVAGFPHLISAPLLSAARLGGVNVHPGKLPEERGPAPLFWALAEGQSEITVTVHVLDAGEDSGDVVSTTEVPIEPGVTGHELLLHLANAATPHVLRAVRGLLAGDLVRHPQPTTTALRRYRPHFRDGRLDPTKSARAVYTFVAALADRYSLFAECGGDRFFIQRAVSYDEDARCEFEFVLTGDRLILRCEPGVVELELKEDGALFTAEYVETEEELQRALPMPGRIDVS